MSKNNQVNINKSKKMKTENNKSNIEKEEDKRNESESNDIRSRLRKNPNKIKSLYADEYNEKKIKKKEGKDVPPNEKEICRTILDILKKDEKSALFRQPAIKQIPEKANRDYYKLQIKEPRDLGNITKKMKSIKYKIKEFYEDVELCWSNAISYNESNTDAYKNAIYMKELCDKLYKEYGVFDLINKEKNDNPNETENNNNANNEEVNGKEEVKDENINEKENNTNNNENTNETKPHKMVGRKRKRPINNNTNTDNDTGVKKDKKKEVNSDIGINKYSFSDVKKKFILLHPIITNPDNINKIVKKMNSKRKKNTKKNNIQNLLQNKKINNNNNSHKHHKSKQHLAYLQNKRNSISKNKEIIYNNEDIIRKVNYIWIPLLHFNGSSFYYLNQDNKDKEKSDKKFHNISEFKFNLNKNKKQEIDEMGKYDNNCNSENVFDLEEMKKRKENALLKQNEEPENINRSNNNCGASSNKETHHKNSNKKYDKNYALRNDIAKYFDKLSDNNMIELLVFIENIRPQSIKELANDTIYINMELFNDDTFSKVLEFVKTYT